jgi:hypothetical protein
MSTIAVNMCPLPLPKGSTWKERELIWKCNIFAGGFNMWAERIKKQTGRAGTQELCSFLLETPDTKYEDVWEAFEKEKLKRRISTTKVRQWLRGKVCPDQSSIEAICKVFSISMKFFEATDTNPFYDLHFNKEAYESEANKLRDYAEGIGASECFINYVTHIENIVYYLPYHDPYPTDYLPEDIGIANNPYVIQIKKENEDENGEQSLDFITETDIDYLKKLSAEVEDFIKAKMLLERFDSSSEERLASWRVTPGNDSLNAKEEENG